MSAKAARDSAGRAATRRTPQARAELRQARAHSRFVGPTVGGALEHGARTCPDLADLRRQRNAAGFLRAAAKVLRGDNGGNDT